MMNSGELANFGHSEGDQVTKMSQQLSQLMKEKRRTELEVENLKITTKILAAHNQELLKHVSNYACSGDAKGKMGREERSSSLLWSRKTRTMRQALRKRQ